MYLKKYLGCFKDKNIKLFIDMDGVIADYIFGEAKDYDKKRPLYDSINKLEEISKMPNVELYIFQQQGIQKELSRRICGLINMRLSLKMKIELLFLEKKMI